LRVKYIHAHAKIEIICPDHGSFWQTARSHLNGNGCPRCTGRGKTTPEFIAQAREVHGDRYDYSQTEYNGRVKVEIVCSDHGSFWQTPGNHLIGHGCPSCADYGFNSEKPGILYYLEVKHFTRTLYKVGITNRSVNERFNKEDLDKITVLSEEYFERGEDALKKESRIKRRFRKHQYIGPPILSNGNTELFTVDILNHAA
jgi:hypothetical protein